jgi:hypothetical protein
MGWIGLLVLIWVGASMTAVALFALLFCGARVGDPGRARRPDGNALVAPEGRLVPLGHLDS